jgi:hypothetical protein
LIKVNPPLPNLNVSGYLSDSSQFLIVILALMIEAAAPVDEAAEEAATSTPIETRLGDDGVGYTWEDFVDYYDDAETAVQMWEAAQVVAPEPTLVSTSPCLEPGSLVRVLADMTPGAHPTHAWGIQVAKVLALADEGHYFVAPVGSRKRRRVSGALLIPTSIHGVIGNGRSGGTAARAIARVKSSAERSIKEAQAFFSQAVKNAERMVLAAQRNNAQAIASGKKKKRGNFDSLTT